MAKQETKDKTIPIIKLEYWDNTKYFLRTDRPDKEVKDLIQTMSRNKGAQFLQLAVYKQLKIKKETFDRLGGLVRLTKMTMTEKEYLNVPMLSR